MSTFLFFSADLFNFFLPVFFFRSLIFSFPRVSSITILNFILSSDLLTVRRPGARLQSIRDGKTRHLLLLPVPGSPLPVHGIVYTTTSMTITSSTAPYPYMELSHRARAAVPQYTLTAFRSSGYAPGSSHCYHLNIIQYPLLLRKDLHQVIFHLHRIRLPGKSQ